MEIKWLYKGMVSAQTFLGRFEIIKLNDKFNLLLNRQIIAQFETLEDAQQHAKVQLIACNVYPEFKEIL